MNKLCGIFPEYGLTETGGATNSTSHPESGEFVLGSPGKCRPGVKQKVKLQEYVGPIESISRISYTKTLHKNLIELHMELEE